MSPNPISNNPESSRKILHRRTIECTGYQRDDGLYDIEGKIVDIKAYDFPNKFRGMIRSGEPIHDMSICLTIDEDMVVRNASARIDSAPYRPCASITPAYGVLRGEKIGPGWTRKTKSLFGREKGCIHLLDLLSVMATVAFQTIMPLRARRKAGLPDQENGQPPAPIGQCHAWASDGEVVKEFYPHFYTGK